MIFDIMGVGHQQRFKYSSQHYTPTIMFHLRPQNKSKHTMSAWCRTLLSVCLFVTISYLPSLVLCVVAQNESAGAKLDYLGVSSTTAKLEDTPSFNHAVKHKGKMTTNYGHLKHIEQINIL